MFCSNCGAKLSDDAKFCLNCGTKIDAPTPAAEPAPVVPVAPVAPAAPIGEAPTPVAEPTPAAEAVTLNDSFAISQSVAPAPAPAPAPKKNKTPAWVIAIIIILAVALVGIGGYIVYDQFFADSVSTSADDDDDDKKTSSGITSSGDISSDDTSSDNSSSIVSEDDPSSEQPTSSSSTSSKTPAKPKINSNYTAFYTNNNVTEDATPSFITRCDSYQVYGHEVTDGVVEKMEAGYNDGVLTNMRNVVYYTHSALAAQWGSEDMVTDANINTLISNWKTQFEAIDNLDFATVSYVKEDNLVKIVIDYTNLDNSSNCEKVFGQLGTQSIEQHKSLMKQYGYIEKYVD